MPEHIVKIIISLLSLQLSTDSILTRVEKMKQAQHYTLIMLKNV